MRHSLTAETGHHKPDRTQKPKVVSHDIRGFDRIYLSDPALANVFSHLSGLQFNPGALKIWARPRRTVSAGPLPILPGPCFASHMRQLPISSPETLKGDSAITRSVRTIGALILREMGSTYGRSPGGYIWAFLEPIGMILILSIAFSLIVRTPSLGTSFLLFYASGFLPFQIYAKIESKVNGALSYSRSLLAYPRVTWLDAVLARAILNFLTMTMVLFVLLTGILIATDSRTVIDLEPIAISIVLMALVGFGVGLTNGVIKGLLPVWKQIWNILSRPLFIISGVIFIYEDLPPVAQDILWWNPMFHGTGLVRSGIYPTYDATYVSLPYFLGFGLLFTAIGLLLMSSHYKRALED